MANRFTSAASDALGSAMAAARSLGHTYIGTEHLLLGLLSVEGAAKQILTARGASEEQTRAMIIEMTGSGSPTNVGPGDMTPRIKRLIESAARESARLGHSYIGTEHLLLAMLGEPDCVALRLLSAQGVGIGELSSDLGDFFRRGGGQGIDEEESEGMSGKDGNESALKKFGRDLTALARDGKIDPVIGREKETERVIQILSRRTKNNPCLIGEPGVGKTAVVEGLARRIAEGVVPETLEGKRIITLDIPGMIAGAKYRGEFEDRMKGVMKEVSEDKSIILFIDEIHTIIGAGAAEGAVDAANIIKPALARGDMQVIGATTISEYRAHIEKDAALERRFQSVSVGEPTPEEAVLILRGLRDKYEAHHKVKITDEAIDAAVKYSVRYIADRYLPDKAIDLIDEAASKVRIGALSAPAPIKELEEKLRAAAAEKEAAVSSQDFERAAEKRDEEKRLTEELEHAKDGWKNRDEIKHLSIGESDIAEIVHAWTGIPVERLGEDESERLLHLEDELHRRIIGQKDAVSAVSRAIRRARVGLGDPRRPMGSFIFLGPTGVGKTELCKALAAALFGDENAMIRIDMSEYMEKHSVSKMIGSPPGYVGFDDGGQLTEKIRRNPYSVVLFDEIEKAHPDVFNILLQILEDGILTDAKGRKVSFKNAIIIMTSNIGASSFTDRSAKLGFGGGDGDKTGENDGERVREKVLEALRSTFRPELINRLDEIIIFDRLSAEEIESIARLMLRSVEKRLSERGITCEFSPEVVSVLAKEGTDPVYGARPMRRVIQSRVEDALSTEMLEGRIGEGSKIRAVLDADGKTILFKPADEVGTETDKTAAPADGKPADSSDDSGCAE